VRSSRLAIYGDRNLDSSSPALDRLSTRSLDRLVLLMLAEGTGVSLPRVGVEGLGV
jgi:hypothetical protein